MKKIIVIYLQRILQKLLPVLSYIKRNVKNTVLGNHVVVCSPADVWRCKIGDYTYLSINSIVHHTTIGKFCSIGPNFFCGWGLHPITGISTHPIFYSLTPPNDVSLVDAPKSVVEKKDIVIGNDVFIGANVTVLDGVTIGDGAVVGAGAVVSKDIPPYAIAVGCPIRIINYRFTEEVRNKLLATKWWDFDEDGLKDVEKLFFEPEAFIDKYL